jgi:hypothetical protein
VRKIFEVEYCEPLKGRASDAKNRVHAGKEVSEALKEGKDVFIVIGEEVTN